MTPARALYGRELPGSGDWDIPALDRERKTQKVARRTLRAEIREKQLNFNQKHYQADAHPAVTFKLGDKVMARELRPFLDEFHPKWTGPHEIVLVNSPETYSLIRDGLELTYHVDHLRPAPRGNAEPDESNSDTPYSHDSELSVPGDQSSLEEMPEAARPGPSREPTSAEAVPLEPTEIVPVTSPDEREASQQSAADPVRLDNAEQDGDTEGSHDEEGPHLQISESEAEHYRMPRKYVRKRSRKWAPKSRDERPGDEATMWPTTTSSGLEDDSIPIASDPVSRSVPDEVQPAEFVADASLPGVPGCSGQASSSSQICLDSELRDPSVTTTVPGSPAIPPSAQVINPPAKCWKRRSRLIIRDAKCDDSVTRKPT